MWVAAIMCATNLCVHGAVVMVETFSSGNNGWVDRDAGEMAVSHQASVGSPASAAMQGSFGAQGVALPQTDAWRIFTGSDFIGNYTTMGTGGIPLTQIQFDLFADNVLPSDVFIRLMSGADTFSYQFSLGSLSVDAWTTFSVNLAWSYGWMGTSESAFNSALANVTQLDIQLTRSGTGSQLYYLDNVTTRDDPIIIEGGGSAIPEPSKAGLMLFGAALVAFLRGRTRHLFAEA